MKYLQNILFILCIAMLYACDDDAIKIEGGYATCSDRTIISVLKNEQVYIRKDICIEDPDDEKAFYFETTLKYLESHGNTSLYPCNRLPEEYRIEGLSIEIGGNITSCTTLHGCSGPTIDFRPTYIFELRTIKNQQTMKKIIFITVAIALATNVFGQSFCGSDNHF